MCFEKLFKRPKPEPGVVDLTADKVDLLTSDEVGKLIAKMKKGETQQFHLRADDLVFQDRGDAEYFLLCLAFEMDNPIHGDYRIENGHGVLEVNVV